MHETSVPQGGEVHLCRMAHMVIKVDNLFGWFAMDREIPLKLILKGPEADLKHDLKNHLVRILEIKFRELTNIIIRC